MVANGKCSTILPAGENIQLSSQSWMVTFFCFSSPSFRPPPVSLDLLGVCPLLPPQDGQRDSYEWGEPREKWVVVSSYHVDIFSQLKCPGSISVLFFKVPPPWGGAREVRGRIACGHCPHWELGRDFLDLTHASSPRSSIALIIAYSINSVKNPTLPFDLKFFLQLCNIL